LLEERRLLYVGITRAMDRLYLVHPLHRSTYGFAEPTDPSRFLDDIPETLLERQGTSSIGHRKGSYGRSETSYRPDQWAPASPAPVRTMKETRYPPGSRVLHPVWGEGMVLNSRLQDDDEIVDIFFEEMGLKRVAASLARLELKS
jgi:DNA helicase II / ATP-dependent DNA helicase PcrA